METSCTLSFDGGLLIENHKIPPTKFFIFTTKCSKIFLFFCLLYLPIPLPLICTTTWKYGLFLKSRYHCSFSFVLCTWTKSIQMLTITVPRKVKTIDFIETKTFTYFQKHFIIKTGKVVTCDSWFWVFF